jgi:tRNA1(Val) A37 N6-methylase TrmN6
VHPHGGQLPDSRCWRKVIQVENMFHHCAALINAVASIEKHFARPLKVVEFCAGSGYVALPLASSFSNHNFIIIDAKVCFSHCNQRILIMHTANINRNSKRET